MVISKNSRKHWRNLFWLTLPVALPFIALSTPHLRHGEIYVYTQERYDSRNAVVYLSRQLWLHPFSERVGIQWAEEGEGRMVVHYNRDGGKLLVSYEGSIGPDPYYYDNVTDAEIHEWSAMGVAIDSAKKLHTQHLS